MGNGTKIGLVLVLVLIVVVCLNVFDGTGPEELTDPEAGKGGSAAVGKNDSRVAANGANRSAEPKRNETARPNRPSSTDSTRSRTTPPVNYDAGRERRLSGDRRTNGTTPPADPRAGNGTAGNGTVGNGTVGNGTVGNGTVGNGSRSSSLPITGRPTGADRSRTNPTPRSEGSRISPSPTGVGSRVRPPANGAESAGSDRTRAGNTSTDPKIGNSGREGTGTVRPAVTPGGRTATGTPANATGTDPKAGTDPKPDGPPAIIGRKPGEGSSSRTVPPKKPEVSAAKKESAPPRGTSPTGTWPKTHEIVEGDSLWELAGRYYEKKTLFTHILENNPQLGDGSELRVGDRLKIPAPPRAVAKKPTGGSGSGTSGGASARVTKPGFQTYTILDGDTLYDIAEDKLGSGLRWTEIQSANPGLDPARLKVGDKIQVPAS